MITVLVVDGVPRDGPDDKARLGACRVCGDRRAGRADRAAPPRLPEEMPGPAGEAAIAEIGRADPAARILALSHKDRAMRHARHGTVAMLDKPFTESELLSVVRGSLARPAPRTP
jgi:hypothetical protein